MASRSKRRKLKQKLRRPRKRTEDIPIWLTNMATVALRAIVFLLILFHQMMHNFIIMLIDMPTYICYKTFFLIVGPDNFNIIICRLIPLTSQSGYMSSLLAITSSMKKDNPNMIKKYLITMLNFIFLVDYFYTKTGLYMILLVYVSLANGCLASNFNDIFLRIEAFQLNQQM
ncbi:PREDICTED: uncharacterized protein LOC108558576 [Nicrophorus vespilloides]|uniref:Uncharacterized protein LOC108558576 n=1 Tax=Nicrophorus vespilloides TaxID=110193 RepID=A0ABM1M8X6_NICVS|nr:PREDICTED: uncharacterized protein LOC108558576 [Nicrophorus vespilloides]